MTKAVRTDAGRAARFPRGHCGRAGCACTHSHGCDHGWLETEAYTHRGVRYDAPQDPCPVCRPEAVERMLAGSTTVPTDQPPPPPTPPRPDDLPPELWADGEWQR